jgi:plastocyanin
VLRTTTLAILVVLAVLGTACGRDDTAATPPPTGDAVDLSTKNFKLATDTQQVEVDALDNQFTPPYVEVAKGATVTFANDGRNEHNVLPVVDGAFAPIATAAFAPGTSVAVTFDQVGDFPYYCSLHGTPTKGMTGAIRVVE